MSFAHRSAALIIALLATLGLVTGAEADAPVPASDYRQGDGRISAFYRWQGTMPVKPGVLLRTETLPPELRLADADRQLRLLYSATDGVTGRGLVTVSGALFLPHGTPPKDGWPIVAWAHGTVGVADICAPSWAGRSYRDVRYLNAWLASGYAVVATDYQGLGTPGPHPYIAARPEAYSVLDSVRAALATGAPLANKVVVVGQSQGGGAAVATLGFAPGYAPDIHLLGAVATGVPNLSPAGLAATPPADPDAVDPTLAYSYYLFLAAQASHRTADPATAFTPAGQPLLDEARTACIFALESDVTVARLTRRQALRPDGFRAVLTPMLPSLLYPTLRFAAPVFVGTGLHDHDVAPAAQLALVQAACAAGSTVVSRTYPEDHSGTVNAAFADASAFVRALIDGRPVASTCATDATRGNS